MTSVDTSAFPRSKCSLRSRSAHATLSLPSLALVHGPWRGAPVRLPVVAILGSGYAAPPLEPDRSAAGSRELPPRACPILLSPDGAAPPAPLLPRAYPSACLSPCLAPLLRHPSNDIW